MGEIYIGKPLNLGQPGDKIAVQIPGQAKSIIAKAAAHVNSFSNVTVTIDDNQVARVFCDSSPQLVKQEVGNFYKSSPSEAVSSTACPIKILFYGTINGVTGFYVGGDRPNPQRIDVPPLFGFNGFTNSGRGLNNWIAAFIKNNSSPHSESKLTTTYMVDGLGSVYENTPEIYGGAAPQNNYRGNGPLIEYLVSYYPAENYGDTTNRALLIQRYYYQDFYFWSSTLRNFLLYDYNINRNVNRNRTLTVSTFKNKSKSSGSGWTFNWIDEGLTYIDEGSGYQPYNGNTIPKDWNVLESFIKPDFALQSGMISSGNLVHWNPLLNGKDNETAIALKANYINADNKSLLSVGDIRDISSVSIDEKEYEFFFVDSDNILSPIDKDVIFNFGFQLALNPPGQFLKLSTSQEWAEHDSRTHYGTLVENALYKPIINKANNNQFSEDGTLNIRGYNFINKTYIERSANFYKIPPGSNILKIAYYPV